MKALAGLLLAALLALATLPAQAGIATAPGRDLRVELVTYGPGRVYWERFGHVALILLDIETLLDSADLVDAPSLEAAA